MLNKNIDDADRLLAAGELEKNAVVLAGAGTGKTTLLVDRLALLIVGKGLPVEKIVALTFTKKAAEEMRVRLESILRDVIVYAETGEPPLRPGSLLIKLLQERYSADQSLWQRRAEKALEDIPKSQIGTIHSFASYLLRLYPLQGKVDPAFREDEGEKFDDLFMESWGIWLSDELGESAPRGKLWLELLKVADLSDLRDLAEALASPRFQWESIQKAESIQSLAKGWSAEFKKLLVQNPPTDRAFAQKNLLTAMGLVFDRLSQGKVVEEDLADQLKNDATINDVFDELYSLAKAAVQVNEQVIHLALDVLKPFVNKFREDLRKRGIVSFDGLLVFARNMVRDSLEVRRALKRQFETFLIDEFQDTDPLQGEILFYLAEDPDGQAKRWNDVKLLPGRLFVVGDPKQSIYRFRGADIAAFESFQQAILSNKKDSFQATLSQNFRSGPGLIGFINETMTPLIVEKAGLQPAYIPLISGREADKSAPVSYVDLNIDEEESSANAEEARRLEGRAVAEWVKTYKGPFSDIALLFRSTSGFAPYLSAFREAGIPYLAEGEKFFYRTPEVMEFLNVLSVIHRPDDTLALVGVLRSPLGGLTDREIWDLKKANGFDIRKKTAILTDKVGELYGTLLRLHEKSAYQTVSEVVEGIFQETFILPLASQAIQSEQALANLQKIRLLAEKWSADGSLTLGSFLKRFMDYRRDEKEEGENPLADVKYDAVKVMTIHKAKGLEFSSVILPDLHRLPTRTTMNPSVLEVDWRSGRVGLRLKNSKIINAAMMLIEEDIKLREEAESRRVFYVALTRAKNNLRLYLRTKDTKGVFVNYLTKAGAFPGEANPHVLGEFSFPVERVTMKAGTRAALSTAPSHKNGQSLEVKDLALLFQARQADYEQAKRRRLFVSPSIKMNEPEKVYLPESEEGERRSDPLHSEKAIRLGLVCHKVMEEWDFSEKMTSLKNLNQLILKAGREFELVPDDPLSATILAEADDILRNFLKSPSYEMLQGVKILGREVPFLYPLNPQTNDGAQVMRGVIDVLYERDRKLIIGDYKTTTVRDGSIEKTAGAYQIQSDIYRDVVKKIFNKEAQFEVIFLRNGQSVTLS